MDHLCRVKMYSRQNQIHMKKLLLATLTMFMLFSIIPVQLHAGVETRSVPATPATVPAEVTVMLNRLDEIHAMDMSALGKVEKKELRKEVKAIKGDLRAAGQGVYLSVGAIIIIVLLLILLL
jgi:hypothetical protein